MNRILLAAAIVMIGATSCTSTKKEVEEAGKFAITNPITLDTAFTKEYVSQIQSVKNIEIRAQEKGFLEKIFVDEGQHVKAGQVLFRIMPKIYEAEYLKTQAVVKEAELELLNSTTLADKNIVSKNEQAIQQAKLDEAKAEMALAKLHLSFTEIKAPFDGIIDRLPKKLGSLIDEGELLTSLSDNNQVFAYFNVSEPEYLDYQSNAGNRGSSKVQLLLANGKELPYPGEVEVIEGEFNNETGNIAFRARFPNPDKLLKHGETGKVLMTMPLKNALIIPQKATYEIQDKLYVFVVDKNNVVKSRNITIKGSLPDLYVIDSGLSAGDKIVLEGVQKLKDDEKINVEYENPSEVLKHLRLKAE